MAVTSHAKCRSCGGNRHKTAKFNMCQACWTSIKPEVRHNWRTIKQRRKLRRAVEEHLDQVRRDHERQRAAREVAVSAPTTQDEALRLDDPVAKDWYHASPDEIKAEIERMRKDGVPALNTKARVDYMHLFQALRKVENRTALLADPREDLIARLYIDSDVPPKQILKALGINDYVMSRARKLRGHRSREDTHPWRPKGRIVEGEELVVIHGQALMCNPDGKLRPLWPDQKVPERVAPEPEKTGAAEMLHKHEPDEAHKNGTDNPPGKRAPRVRRSEELKAEIARWYADPNIPVREIMGAYGIATGSLDRIRQQFGLPLRGNHGKRPQSLGRFEVADGQFVWVPADSESPSGNPSAAAWIASAEARLAAEQAKLPAPQTAAPPSPPTALATVADVIQRAWALTYVVQRVEIIAAPSIDEALRRLREDQGADVDVVGIQRA